MPAPLPVLEALQTVQVNSSASAAASSSRSRWARRRCCNVLLPAGFFDPIVTRVIIVVTLNGVPNVLMDGMVTRQELAPGNEPGQSTLTITGEDLSVVMDVVEMPLRYPGHAG